MIIWIGAEYSGTELFGHNMRTASNFVEKVINEVTLNKKYELNLDKLRLILILMETAEDRAYFTEHIRYYSKKKIADFKLQLDYETFRDGTDLTRQRMIYQTLLRSLNILEKKGLSKTGLDALRHDLSLIALQHDWVECDGFA